MTSAASDIVDPAATMPTPFDSAPLELPRFDLRREPVPREARAQFPLEFTPATTADVAP